MIYIGLKIYNRLPWMLHNGQSYWWVAWSMSSASSIQLYEQNRSSDAFWLRKTVQTSRYSVQRYSKLTQKNIESKQTEYTESRSMTEQSIKLWFNSRSANNGLNITTKHNVNWQEVSFQATPWYHINVVRRHIFVSKVPNSWMPKWPW